MGEAMRAASRSRRAAPARVPPHRCRGGAPHTTPHRHGQRVHQHAQPGQRRRQAPHLPAHLLRAEGAARPRGQRGRGAPEPDGRGGGEHDVHVEAAPADVRGVYAHELVLLRARDLLRPHAGRDAEEVRVLLHNGELLRHRVDGVPGGAVQAAAVDGRAQPHGNIDGVPVVDDAHHGGCRAVAEHDGRDLLLRGADCRPRVVLAVLHPLCPPRRELRAGPRAQGVLGGGAAGDQGVHAVLQAGHEVERTRTAGGVPAHLGSPAGAARPVAASSARGGDAGGCDHASPCSGSNLARCPWNAPTRSTSPTRPPQ